MHRILACAIVLAIVLIIYIHLNKCKYCPCNSNCSCVTSGCCCTQSAKEKMATPKRRVELHFTNWCPACKRMKPIWEQVKASVPADSIQMVEIDEDQARTPWVDAYPTIVAIEDGVTYKYAGGPDYLKLRQWILAPSIPL